MTIRRAYGSLSIRWPQAILAAVVGALVAWLRSGASDLVVGTFVAAALGFGMYWQWTRSRKVVQTAWSRAAAMTFGIPDSPFSRLDDHREAVRMIYRLRGWSAQAIAAEAMLPRPFVEAVLPYFDPPPDGGSGSVAWVGPRGPRPRAVAE